MKRIEDLIWHDGQLVSFVAEFTKERTWTTRLSIDVYPDDAASERQRVCVECHRVERSSTIFDFVELLDNHNAGNIANGYVKRFGKKKLLRISMMDGYLDVICAEVSLHAEKQPA